MNQIKIKNKKMNRKRNQHVIPTETGWAVKGERNFRITNKTETKDKAIVIARQIAKNQKTELVIHNRDGKIIDKDSFGNDPHPSKDKKH
jgi:hypothetical protein